jgi:hypothetical protein
MPTTTVVLPNRTQIHTVEAGAALMRISQTGDTWRFDLAYQGKPVHSDAVAVSAVVSTLVTAVRAAVIETVIKGHSPSVAATKSISALISEAAEVAPSPPIGITMHGQQFTTIAGRTAMVYRNGFLDQVKTDFESTHARDRWIADQKREAKRFVATSFHFDVR